MRKNKQKTWYDAFTDYVIETWKKKGTVVDEAKTRENLDAMLFLIGNYRLTCLMAALVDIDDLICEFNESDLGRQYNE